MQPIVKLVIAGAAMFATLGLIAGLSGMYSLNIKAKTVGHGQHGTARWATKGEIKKTYTHVRFEPELWRKGEHLPTEQGIVVGCLTRRHRLGNALRAVRNVMVVKLLRKSHAIPKTADETTALVDTGDVHAVMIGAAGVGKTSYWLYPCLEYALASGMSFLSTDTKGDVVRNYGRIAQECYGYRVGVIDLRNPTRSDGFNLPHLVNKYMDAYREHPDTLLFKAKAERYAKIISKCKNRHPSPICTRFEHHFHVLKPHLHRRSFSDTLPENQRHLIALKRYPLWHMQKLCQLSQLAELRSTFFRNRNAVLCQDVLQLSNPLALSLEFFLSCVKVFHRLTLHLVVAGPFQF